MTALDSPPIASRLRDVASSPVREILALTARPGVISFAGGLPAPELFDAAGLREAFAAALSDERAGRSLQYSTTEGDPELRAAIAARLDRPRVTDRGRPAARHERLAAGAHPGRRGADRARRPRARGGAVLPGGAAGVHAGRRGGRPRRVRRRRARSRRGGRRGLRARRAPALHDPDLPQPDRAHAAARAPARARGDRRAARPVADRGRPVRRASLPRRAAAEPRHDGRGPHARALDALEGRRPGAADRLGADADALCAGRWWSPSRPPTCTPRPSTRRPPRAGWAPSTSTRTSASCGPSTAAAATRCSTACWMRCLRGRPTTAPRAACSSGRGCPAAGTPSRCWHARSPTTSPSCPAIRSSPASPTAPTLRFSFTTHSPAEIAEGLERLRRAWG